ncbi:phosphatase PAP2 family protein [Uruburuella testudinis]|uniref:Phosphatase PAP2 family protein n=1 Tax=Uruburuella testudinis TaxID=1282863 RepID=A0ABY4DZ16_9NEIS|nr:phosphatase PAP2 family protein [Uruburuella testudinis]UOO81936.1 phosphatase PAP2 family protein [Uruburuella testudinis]
MKYHLPAVLAGTDTRLFFWFNRHSRKRFVGRAGLRISRCGDGHLYAAAGLALWLWGNAQGAAFFYTGLLAYALELPLYRLLKNSIRRSRPCHGICDIDALIEPSDKFSFPSGHTAAAFVFAALVAAFYPLFAPFAYTMAVLIGLSRVILGVHYPSDIAAGALLGTLCGLAAVLLAGA